MNCPDCGYEITIPETAGMEPFCQNCPSVIPFEELYGLISNVITGEQLQDIVNFTVDLGYDIKYVTEGELARKGYFRKIYREQRKPLVDIDLPPDID